MNGRVLFALCAGLLSGASSVSAQVFNPCWQVGTGIIFLAEYVQELADRSHLKVVRGSRHFCQAGMAMATVPNLFEVRDANQGCATIIAGQLVDTNLPATSMQTLCPAGTTFLHGRVASVAEPLSDALSHLAVSCRGASLITVHVFFSGAVAISTSVPRTSENCFS